MVEVSGQQADDGREASRLGGQVLRSDRQLMARTQMAACFSPATFSCPGKVRE